MQCPCHVHPVARLEGPRPPAPGVLTIEVLSVVGVFELSVGFLGTVTTRLIPGEEPEQRPSVVSAKDFWLQVPESGSYRGVAVERLSA